MEDNNNKNSIVLTVIAVATLLVAVVGATFAYFQATTGTGASTNVKVTTGTAGSTTFTVGSAINITADQTTFASSAGNRTGSTTGSAKFVAPTAVSGTLNDSDLNSCYKVTIAINPNGFTYTQNTSTPELLLNVTKNNSELTTGITGLTYTTVTDGKSATLKGWDITNKTGTFTLGSTHTLTATAGGTKEDSWNVTVTLVNLNANQNTNAGKSLSGTLTFTSATC